MQNDPNATGMVVLKDSSRFHGEIAWMVPQDMELLDHLRDGANTYEYLASSPWNSSDPMGLFMLGLSMAQSGVSAYESAQGVLDSARMMRNEAFGLRSMIDTYAAMQLMDAEIAETWSLPDDWFHATGWYGFANSGGVIEESGSSGGHTVASEWIPLGDRFHNRGANGVPTRHGMAVRALAKVMSLRYGPQNVRMNQMLSDLNGKTLANIKPDIQVWDPKREKWVVVEIEDGNVMSNNNWKTRQTTIQNKLGADTETMRYNLNTGRLEGTRSSVGRTVRRVVGGFRR